MAEYAREPWWPSPWGSDDQLGAANYLNRQTALAAAGLIRSGEVVDLSHPLTTNMPCLHDRDYELAGTCGAVGPTSAERYFHNEELIVGNITGTGTHFSGLAHIGKQLGADSDHRSLHYYNGFSHAEIATDRGFAKLGTENVPPIFTTAILVDFRSHFARILDPGEMLTEADFHAVLAKQRLSASDIEPGTVVLWRTGIDELWDDHEAYLEGRAGISLQTAEWLADLGVVMAGSDAPALEPKPYSPIDPQGCVHATFNCYRGVYILMNLDLRRVSELCAYRFALSFAPLAITGAQSSPARPAAIL